MTPRLLLFGVLTLGLSFLGIWMLGSGTLHPAEEFAVASLHLDQDAVSGRLEVVLTANGGAEGLAKLRVLSPSGRVVTDFTAADARTLGIGEFHLESPEPQLASRILAAYPEGSYRFEGTAVTGKRFRSSVDLSHERAAAPELVTSLESARAGAMELRWTKVQGATYYRVELRPISGDERFSVQIATEQVLLPEGFLRPQTTYQLMLTAVLANGNRTHVDRVFSTP